MNMGCTADSQRDLHITGPISPSCRHGYLWSAGLRAGPKIFSRSELNFHLRHFSNCCTMKLTIDFTASISSCAPGDVECRVSARCDQERNRRGESWRTMTCPTSVDRNWMELVGVNWVNIDNLGGSCNYSLVQI